MIIETIDYTVTSNNDGKDENITLTIKNPQKQFQFLMPVVGRDNIAQNIVCKDFDKHPGKQFIALLVDNDKSTSGRTVCICRSPAMEMANKNGFADFLQQHPALQKTDIEKTREQNAKHIIWCAVANVESILTAIVYPTSVANAYDMNPRVYSSSSSGPPSPNSDNIPVGPKESKTSPATSSAPTPSAEFPKVYPTLSPSGPSEQAVGSSAAAVLTQSMQKSKVLKTGRFPTTYYTAVRTDEIDTFEDAPAIGSLPPEPSIWSRLKNVFS